MKKGPGFKPTPIASRTSGAPKPKLEIGEVTVTDVPKKPKLEIGEVTVRDAPKPKLEIGEVTVRDAPKAPAAPSAPKAPAAPTRVAAKSDGLSGGEAYAAMGKADTAEYLFRKLTEKLRRRAQGGGRRDARRAQKLAFGKGGEVALPRPKTEWATPRENMSRMSYGARKKHSGGFIERRKQGIKDLGTVTVSAKTEKSNMGKALRVMSVGDYYDSVMKAEGGPPAPSAPGTPAVKKFPRKEKPTVKMKPISDQEAMTNLRAGKFYEKSLRRQLATIKALATGYNKVSGGGALKAANRGSLSVADLNRAMEVMPKPSGSLPPATTYLPGVHGPEVRQRAAKIRSKASKRQTAKSNRPTTSSKKSPRALDGGGATMLASMTANEQPTLKKPPTVVHKSEGAATMSKTNFNDLFKSELGIANDEVLVDCPHCEAPITKSDLAKGHKGKGAATNVSGPKTAGGSLRAQNPEGGTMRGGDGKGQVTSSRGVPGAQKTDAVVGVQNGKGSARKSAADDDGEDLDKGDGPIAGGMKTTPKTSDAGDQGRVSMRGVAQAQAAKPAAAAPKPTQVAAKGMSVRGTDFVQYVDYGDAPGGDAYIAKSIAEAQGAIGQQATQPMDLNNDLSRLLV